MTIYSALLLLSATGSASRTIEVQDSIAGIVASVVAGGVRDVVARRTHGTNSAGPGFDATLETLSLRIDGQPRAGIAAWGTAAERVAAYALDARADGVVSYGYSVRVRGFIVRRHTEISDGRVTLTTDVYGSIGPRAELTHVRLVLCAVGSGNHTRLSGTATGWSRIGNRCRLVRRIAEREISRAMQDVLGRIEAGGTGLYRAGSAESLIEALR